VFLGANPLDELLRKAWIANGHSIAYGVIAPTEHNIDQFNKANVPGIYAIGGVSGPPMVAHRGRARGRRLSDLAVWNNRSVAASVANPRRPPIDFDGLALVASVNGYPITSTERVFDV
jgi:hypothetical protein